MNKTFDFTNLCERYKETPTNHDHLAEIKKSNEVIRLFTTEYVMKNVEELKTDTEGFFWWTIRAYYNIFFLANNKPRLYKTLCKLNLDDRLIRKIMILSIPGRYSGAPRSLQSEGRYNEFTRSAFLDAIVAFEAKDLDDNSLYGKLETIALEPRTGLGPAFLSGLSSALCPERFMVYNKRSTEFLSKYNAYKHFTHTRTKKYRNFNELHQKIAKQIKTPLVNLDTRRIVN